MKRIRDLCCPSVAPRSYRYRTRTSTCVRDAYFGVVLDRLEAAVQLLKKSCPRVLTDGLSVR
jgi:hypothetical protein